MFSYFHNEFDVLKNNLYLYNLGEFYNTYSTYLYKRVVVNPKIDEIIIEQENSIRMIFKSPVAI